MKVYRILLILVVFASCTPKVKKTKEFTLPRYSFHLYDTTVTGYYFVAETNTMMILDGKGKLIHHVPQERLFNFALQKSGTILFSDSLKFFMMDSAFTVTDTLTCTPPYSTDRHDLRILPNNHLLMLGGETVTVDLTPYPYWRKKFKRDKAVVRFVVIQELDEQRNVVFEWHGKDYFQFNDVDSFFFKPTTRLLINRDFALDWTHCNSIEMDTDGNILLSSRSYSAVIKINRSTGKVMWQLGGKRNEFKFIDCPVPFYGQHDVRRIKNGHITLYDNGDYLQPHGARALEFDLNENDKTAKLTWSYTFKENMRSRGRGNVQRLENNNTLICFGWVKTDPVCFIMVDSAGNKLVQVDSMRAYRVLYYPTLPWKLPPQSN